MLYLQNFIQVGHEVHQLVNVGRDLSNSEREGSKLVVGENSRDKGPNCVLAWVSREFTYE